MDASWIDTYPYVKALLQQADEALDYPAAAEEPSPEEELRQRLRLLVEDCTHIKG
jgi:hypothetical protein